MKTIGRCQFTFVLTAISVVRGSYRSLCFGGRMGGGLPVCRGLDIAHLGDPPGSQPFGYIPMIGCCLVALCLLPGPAAGKNYARFQELPISDITPEGWLRTFLTVQRDGMTGHLDRVGFPFNTGWWSRHRTKNGEDYPEGIPFRGRADWWSYEQSGYVADALIRCGHLLRDEFMLDKGRERIEYVLAHPGEDGILGPPHLDTARWPHAVFFRSLMAEFSASGDRRILDALTQHYLAITPQEHCVRAGSGRNICNIETLCWLYHQTADQRLLDHALAAYDLFNEDPKNLKMPLTLEALLSDERITIHGVYFLEQAKLPAILYMATGNEKFLQASLNGFRKLDRDHMLIDGVNSSNEGLSGKDPGIYHEVCDITDFSWSAGYLLLATGEAEWADKIERACFNAGFGAVTKDFKASQYFSSVNQVVATGNTSRDHWRHKYDENGQMSYRPLHDCPCCTANVLRFLPNYGCRMWLSDGRGGLVASLYGSSRVRAKLGEKAVEVTVVEQTNYPFSEWISFDVRTAEKVQFPLWLRVPGWCENAAVTVNGTPLEMEMKPGSFVAVQREYSNNDRVVLHLPMSLKLTRWQRGGVGIERGPLVYALPVKENRHPTEGLFYSNNDFPAWEMTPESPWNYALAVSDDQIAQEVRVRFQPPGVNPWNMEHCAPPVQLDVPARRVKGWQIPEDPSDIEKEKADQPLVVRTPPLPDPASLPSRLTDTIETITLVPYGCTQLRMTIFPQCPATIP